MDENYNNNNSDYNNNDGHNFYDSSNSGDSYGNNGQELQYNQQTQNDQQAQYDQQAQFNQQAQYDQQAQFNQQAQYGQQSQYGQQAQYNQSQYSQQTQYYGQQPYPYQQNDEAKTKMGIGRWLLTFLLCAIPIVNLVMLIIWAVSSSPKNAERKNWARAALIWAAIVIVLYIILLCVGISAVGGLSRVSDSLQEDYDTASDSVDLYSGVYSDDSADWYSDGSSDTYSDGSDDTYSDGSSAVSDDAAWLGMGFTLDGHDYTLPFSYSEIAGNGWTFSDDTYKNGYVMNAGDITTVYLENPAYGAAMLSVDVANTGDALKDISECDVYTISYDIYTGYEDEEAPQMSVAGGPSTGMDKEEVFLLLGECDDDDTTKTDGMEWYSYYNSDYSKYLYVTWEEDYGVTGITLGNYAW